MSDRLRGWTALGCALALATCWGWWAHLHATGTIGYGDFVHAPERRDGQEVSLSLVRVSSLEGPDRFSVEKGSLRIAVHGARTGLEVGDDVSLGGRWDGSAAVLELAWVEHRESGRQAKRVLGLLGLVLAGGLLGTAVRPGPGGWVLRG